MLSRALLPGTAVLGYGYGYGPHLSARSWKISAPQSLIDSHLPPPTTLVPVWTLKEPPSTAIPGLFKAELCTE